MARTGWKPVPLHNMAVLSSTELDGLIAAAKKQPQPVYLFIGAPFQTEDLARRVIDALVPEERRSFNVERYDGRTAGSGPILDSLRMRGLFPGVKVVWVREPAFLLSREKRTDITAALFEAWSDERVEEAAEKLLTLVALAGWTQERFTAVEWPQLPNAEIVVLFGRELTGPERSGLDAMRAAALERNLTVGNATDDSGRVQELLARDGTTGAVLVLTATTVDRRKGVVKTIQEVGTVVEFTWGRERSGALSAADVEQLARSIFARQGKRPTPGALALIVRRAGTEPALLAGELEKLCLYVGDAREVAEGDVQISMRDLGESWIFDFTRALAQRQAAPALALLRRLFRQGEHPLRLLALVHRELRLLLLARDCLGDSLASKWNPRVSYTTFRDHLLPLLSEGQREAFGGLHPFALYQCVQNASRASTAGLQRYVLALQELDIRLKSSSSDPRILFEGFVLDVCRGG